MPYSVINDVLNQKNDKVFEVFRTNDGNVSTKKIAPQLLTANLPLKVGGCRAHTVEGYLQMVVVNV